MIEVETQTIEVEVVTNTEVTSTSQVEVETVDLSDLDITVAKKEYVITGDNIYVPMLYADAPQWMKDLVNLAVDVSMETANASSLAQLTSILTEFATSYVPLNQYTQSILDLSNADSSIHSLITTLNSNFKDGLNEANSQIITLSYTKASKAEVVTQVIDTIASQLATPGSSLSSIVARLDQAIVNETSARALSMEVLTASIEDINGGVEATAQAVNTLEASVTNINGTLSAHTGQITNLQTQASTVDGKIATAKSDVTNSLNTVIANGDINVESKWGYNSNISIGGVSYGSGFGLATSVNSPGHGIPTGQSEFWIKADKFKMTTTGYNGTVYSPFSVNGTNGEISFNGKVNFNSVTGAIAGGSNLLYNSAPEVGRELEGWSKGYNTVSGFTHSIAAGYGVNIISGGSSVLSYVPGSPANGSVFDIQQTKSIPVESNTIYELSAYLNCYRCVSEVKILWIRSDGAFISELSGTQVSTATTTTKISDWGRSTLFATSPSDASRCAIFVRSYVTSTDPHCFVARAYFGKALSNQTEFSTWSEGTGPSKSSSDVVADINNAQTTTINGPRITTGSIGAAQIAANSISADRFSSTTGLSSVWTGGGLVSANFNGNVNGDIGTPTSGFRLSSNAAGTSDDPNIYGAYIKGGIVEGTAFLYTTNTVGNFAPYYYNEYKYLNFTVASGSGTVYTPVIQLVSPSYGSGLLPNRVKNLSTSVITIDTTGAIGQLFAENYIDSEIQISIDGGSYTKLDSMTTAEGVNKMYVGTITGYSNYINLRLKIGYGNSSTAYQTAAALKVHLDNTVI